MSHSRHPLRINVGFLLNQPIGTSRTIVFEFPRLTLSEELEVTNLNGSVKLSRTPQGIVAQGKFDAFVAAECVRCLSDFQQHLQSDFSELYAFKKRSLSESCLLLPEDANLDFGPLVNEYLLLEIPYCPVCKENCKGLCLICGSNLNLTTCEHSQQNNSKEEEVDTPFLPFMQALKDFDTGEE